MKFAGYVPWILIYKRCKFGEKICYNSRDIEFFLRGYFFLAHPVYLTETAQELLDLFPLDTVIIIIESKPL